MPAGSAAASRSEARPASSSLAPQGRDDLVCRLRADVWPVGHDRDRRRVFGHARAPGARSLSGRAAVVGRRCGHRSHLARPERPTSPRPTSTSVSGRRRIRTDISIRSRFCRLGGAVQQDGSSPDAAPPAGAPVTAAATGTPKASEPATSAPSASPVSSEPAGPAAAEPDGGPACDRRARGGQLAGLRKSSCTKHDRQRRRNNGPGLRLGHRLRHPAGRHRRAAAGHAAGCPSDRACATHSRQQRRIRACQGSRWIVPRSFCAGQGAICNNGADPCAGSARWSG